jgi:hypothetical protein
VVLLVNDWYVEDILLALQEAKERLRQKPKENNPTFTLSATGLLTVSFQNDI